MSGKTKTMKKRRGPGTRHTPGDLAPEYRFDYAKSRPNRFARQLAKNAVVVVLDPDVAAVFRDPKARADNRLKLAPGRPEASARSRSRAAA